MIDVIKEFLLGENGVLITASALMLMAAVRRINKAISRSGYEAEIKELVVAQFKAQEKGMTITEARRFAKVGVDSLAAFIGYVKEKKKEHESE